MQPTTTGRFRVHDRRQRPDVDESAEEFTLVEVPPEPIDPSAPGAANAFDPLFVSAEGYDGELETQVDALVPGVVVDATLAWDDGTAWFTEVAVVREDRFRFAEDVTGIFEAAVEAWNALRADGEAFGSVTTRSTDGEPNGALYLFADGPGGDTFGELRAGRLPIEPLVARVNERLADDQPREVFVLRPADHSFVLVHVVFDRDGVLARTIRDTYDLGFGLALGLTEGNPGDDEDGADRDSDIDGKEADRDSDIDGFDLRDRR